MGSWGRTVGMADDGGVRLQKVLARAGVASRRNAELLIEEGRVEVDGRVVTEFGVRVDPESAVIRVDGERIPPVSANVYLVLNKPRGAERDCYPFVGTQSHPRSASSGRTTWSTIAWICSAGNATARAQK